MKAFIFDTETTGLIENRTVKLDKQPEIIEFYGAGFDLKKPKAKLSNEVNVLIKPKKDIIPEITKITGITNDLVKDAEPFCNHAQSIKNAIEKSKCVIAHNLSYDMEMVDIEMERLGLKVAWPKDRICTVEQTVHIKGFRLSMSALHEYLFGEPFAGAHRAKVDVSALARCCFELHKREMI